MFLTAEELHTLTGYARRAHAPNWLSAQTENEVGASKPRGLRWPRIPAESVASCTGRPPPY